MVRSLLPVSVVLAVASAAAGQITVSSTSNVASGIAPAGVAIADLNGDGFGDLATVVDAPGDVSIMLGDGLGVLTPAGSINLPQNAGAGDVVAADFDGNGTIDLAVVLKNLSQMAILLNDGAANFTLSSTVVTGEDGSGPTLGDLDGDGDIDIVVANSAVNTVSILRNDGAANFTVTDLAVGADPRGAAFGDFDGDSDLDVAWASHDDRVIGIERNNRGTFTLWTTIPVSNLMRTEQIACGDLNQDGLDDIAVTARGDLGSYPFTILSTGTDFATQPAAFSANGGAIAIALADLDCDGDLDAAFADDHGNAALLVENDGMGVFINPTVVPTGLAAVAVAVGDLDGVGGPDVAIANTDSDSVAMIALECPAGGIPCDFDGDGLVGPTDLGILLGAWLEPGPTDLDGSGTTGPEDMAILLSKWSG